ncbi:MAG: response regulator, partial [Deltaproteobacteria bacterium]|nr:response regulator [Deltaproteobacteria bacterium]
MSPDDSVGVGASRIEVLVPEDLLGVEGGEDILVVDDNATNLVAIEAALAPLGRTVVTAASGIEALAKLLDQDFALILLDVQMPGMSGFETATMIRTRQRSRATPIIFVTGMTWQDKTVLHGYEVGGFDFLTKPVMPEVLRAKARVFLQLQERTRELQRKVSELRAAQSLVHDQAVATDQQAADARVLAERVEQLAGVDRRKDEFLAILGHELRNPLHSLQMAVELLRQRPVGDSAERIHQVIDQRVADMSRLVDDLLDVRRFAAGTIELQREPLLVGQLVRQALDLCSAPLAAKQHHLELELPPAHDLSVLGDRVRLVQVIANLVDNAIKYTPAGGTIAVTVHAADGTASIRVVDTGRGIRADLVPTIFDMFVHDRATTDGHGGLGLGLGLVKRITELHGGTVGARSPGPGRGSTFEVTLPITVTPVVAPPPAPLVGTLPKRLVICDDAEDIRELLADMLRLHGHTVTVTATGAAALLAIAEELPDAALIDLGLPDIDGYEVARAVRAQLGDRCPRLIAVSGFGQARDRERARAAGFDTHLVKPTPVAQLLEAIYATPARA